jgi:hypothetical protein
MGANVLEASKHLPGKVAELGSRGAELSESTYRQVQAYFNPDGSVTVIPSPSASAVPTNSEVYVEFIEPGVYFFETLDANYKLGKGLINDLFSDTSKRIVVKNFVPSRDLYRMPDTLFAHFFPDGSKNQILRAASSESPIPSLTLVMEHPNRGKTIYMSRDKVLF